MSTRKQISPFFGLLLPNDHLPLAPQLHRAGAATDFRSCFFLLLDRCLLRRFGWTSVVEALFNISGVLLALFSFLGLGQ